MKEKIYWIIKIEKPKDGYLPAFIGLLKGYFPKLKIQFKQEVM